MAARVKLRTRLFELVPDMTVDELVQLTGLSTSELYHLKRRSRGVGPRAMQAIVGAFPGMRYERLFFLDDESTVADSTDPEVPGLVVPQAQTEKAAA
jgi:hypothetical protein